MVGLNIGNSFDDNLMREVGNDVSTSFWHDLWIVGDLPNSRFNRFYRLYLDTNISVLGCVGWTGVLVVGVEVEEELDGFGGSRTTKLILSKTYIIYYFSRIDD